MNLPEAFNKELRALGIHEGTPVLLACSGGPDSVALFYLCIQLKIPFSVAHVNYRLRGPESDADANFVQSLCETHRIAFLIYTCTKDDIDTHQSNLQKTARKIRYGFFKQIMQELKFPVTLLAHHRDDDLETFYMQKMRSSGPAVYPGIRKVNHPWIRPLLNFHKQEIVNWLHQHNYSFRIDSGNSSEHYLRNKVRKVLALKQHQELSDFFAVLDLAKSDYEKNAASWNELCKSVYKSYRHFSVIHLNQSYPEKALSFGMHDILRSKGFNNAQFKKIWNHVLSGKSFKQFRSKIYRLAVSREIIIIEQKQTEKNSIALLAGDHQLDGLLIRIESDVLPDYKTHANKDPFTLFLTKERFHLPLMFSYYRIGEKIQPFGMQGKKPISHILRENGVPLMLRKHIPILHHTNGTALWIAGFRASESTRSKANEPCWKISVKPDEHSVYAFLMESYINRL